MTVSSSTNVVILSADGSTHSFSFTFKIFAASDLKVIVRSAAGVETEKTLNSHYIIPTSSVGNTSGGNILFKFNTGTSSDAHYSTTDFRPANGEKVILRRQQPQTQELDLVDNDPFSATLIEEQFDKVVMQIQGVQEAVDRSLKFSRSNLLDSSGSQIGSTYPEIEEDTTARANKILSFDSTGTPIATQEIGTLRGDWAASTAYQERDIVKDTSTSNHFIVNTAHTSSGSQPLTTNTNASKYTAITNFSGATLSPGQLNVDNITIDGNTISTTNSNGDLTVSPNGTGDTIFNSEVKVYGNSLAPTNHIRLLQDDIDLEGAAPNISFFSLDTGSVPRYNTGEVSFYGKNNSGNNIRFAYMQSYQTSKTDGAVAGGIRILASSEANGIEEAAITTLGLDVTIGGKLKMSDVTSGKILIGDGTSYEEQAVSGDITINSSGVTAISSGVIVNADISSSAAIADSKLATITTADKVSGAAIQIDGATDGTGITVADADKLLIDDGGTTKYINASQLNTYISAAASSVAADNITAGDAAVTLTTTSGNITIDAQANNSDIILKGTDGSVDTTFLTISGADAGAATFNSTVTATGFIIGSANINENDLEAIDGITAGTVAASKVVTVDTNKDFSGARNITITGELDANLLTGTLQTAAQTNITSVGTLSSLTVSGLVTADGGIDVDDFHIDGTAISLSAGNLSIDAGDNILLNTKQSSGSGGAVYLKQGGTNYGGLLNSSGELVIQSGSTPTTAVTFSGANATFAGTVASTGVLTANAGVKVDNITIDGTEIDLSSGNLTIDVANDIVLDSGDGDIQLNDTGVTFLNIYESSDHAYLYNPRSNGDIIFQGNGVSEALKLDMSASGAATFNSGITVGGTLDLNSQQISNGSTIGATKGVFTSSATGQLTLNSTSSDYMLEFQRSGTSEWWLKASSSVFQIHENGVGDHLTVKAGGNVGIGETSPDTLLHISGAPDSKVITMDQNGRQSAIGTYFSSGSTDSRIDFYVSNGNTDGSSNNRMSIMGSGNVGIGTTTVDHKLHLEHSDTTPTFMKVENSAANLLVGVNSSGNSFVSAQTSGKPLIFETDNTERMRINSSGNVGIGTTSPGARLQVDDGSGRNLQIAPSGSGIDIISTTNPMRLITSDASHMTFSTNGSSNERMRILNTGKVGIATTSPGADLHVKGTMKIEGDASYFADTLAAVNSTAMSFNMSPARASVTKSIAMGAIGSINTHTGLQAYDSSDNSAHNFNINPFGGRVSIGTSAPVSPAGHNSKLAVEGTDYHGATVSISANSANSNGAYLMFSKSRGTSVGSTTVVADGDTLGYIGFNAADGINVNSASAAIYSQVDGSPGNDDTPGRIVFATTTDDAEVVTNRMYITSAGIKIMNNTSHGNITSGNDSGASFDSQGTLHSSRATTSNSLHWYIYNSNGHVGSVSTNGTATQFNTSSDYRLKENVVTDWDATSRLKQLKPSRFNFKTDKDTTVDGFLAHEVSSIVPEAITGEKDATKKIKGVVLSSTGAVLSDNVKESEWVKGKTTYRDEIQNIDVAQLYPSDSTWVAEKDVPDYQSIDQSKLVPLLVKTIQELEARIAKLEGA